MGFHKRKGLFAALGRGEFRSILPCYEDGAATEVSHKIMEGTVYTYVLASFFCCASFKLCCSCWRAGSFIFSSTKYDIFSRARASFKLKRATRVKQLSSGNFL